MTNYPKSPISNTEKFKQSTTEETLEPCPFCRSAAMLYPVLDAGERSTYGYYVACSGADCFCVLGEGYDRDAMPEHSFSEPEAAIEAWNTRSIAPSIDISQGQWQHVQIKAGNPRVVAISFETAEQATAFINSFAASPASAAPVVDEPRCWHCGIALEATELRPRCDECSADCNDEFCNAFGCAPSTAAATAAPVKQSVSEG